LTLFGSHSFGLKVGGEAFKTERTKGKEAAIGSRREKRDRQFETGCRWDGSWFFT